MEEKRQRKPRQAKMEITADNYMDFSARDLYNEIERLRNQPGMQELKRENTNLKRNLSRIAKLTSVKEVVEQL